MNFYAEPCSCGKAFVRTDTDCCEMCSVFPAHLQFRDTRINPPCTRCSGCGVRLVLPRSRLSGLCAECTLIAGMPDPNDDIDVTEQQAIANVQQIFPGAQVITDTPANDDTGAPGSRSTAQPVSAEQNDAYVATCASTAGATAFGWPSALHPMPSHLAQKRNSSSFENDSKPPTR